MSGVGAEAGMDVQHELRAGGVHKSVERVEVGLVQTTIALTCTWCWASGAADVVLEPV